MKICINGIGNISPQPTWDNSRFLERVEEYHARMIQCMEPGVDPGLDEKYLRRMNRMLRLGWIASKICLDDAGAGVPDAIITGSGWGSVHDSEKFLLSIYKNKENLLPPTPFIQSTHNALGSQIAILLGNYRYNVAYAHASFAFEHALLDAMCRLRNGEMKNVLLGGFDEITDNQFTLISRTGRFKKEPVSNLSLYHTGTSGSIAGEGFTFFCLQGEETSKTYAEVKDVTTLFDEPYANQAADSIRSFLQRNSLDPDDIGWVFIGLNGDVDDDQVYRDVLRKLIPAGTGVAAWKHLCGEYLTASAFAMWAAAKALKAQTVPKAMKILDNSRRKEIDHILVYNHFKGMHHSLILLRRAG